MNIIKKKYLYKKGDSTNIFKWVRHFYNYLLGRYMAQYKYFLLKYSLFIPETSLCDSRKKGSGFNSLQYKWFIFNILFLYLLIRAVCFQ